jgi:hypothetical protein
MSPRPRVSSTPSVPAGAESGSSADARLESKASRRLKSGGQRWRGGLWRRLAPETDIQAILRHDLVALQTTRSPTELSASRHPEPPADARLGANTPVICRPRLRRHCGRRLPSRPQRNPCKLGVLPVCNRSATTNSEHRSTLVPRATASSNSLAVARTSRPSPPIHRRKEMPSTIASRRQAQTVPIPPNDHKNRR